MRVDDLDSLDRQNVVIFGLFGDQQFPAKHLKVTRVVSGPDTGKDDHAFLIVGKSSCSVMRKTLRAKTVPSVSFAFQTSEEPPAAFGVASCLLSGDDTWYGVGSNPISPPASLSPRRYRWRADESGGL